MTMEHLIPAIIILLSNLCSDDHGGPRWQYITATFGWLGCVALTSSFTIPLLSTFGIINKIWADNAMPYVIEFTAFALLAALTRDYERILKPVFKKIFND